LAFGGGGGGALPAHVHNSVPLQGGPLDFANDTIASLNAGSTTFSNGAALQELTIGTPAQTMVVNPAGNAPEWATGGAAGQMVLVSHNVLGADAAAIDVSFTAIGQDDISSLFIYYCGSSVDTSRLRMEVNGLTASLYDSGCFTFVNATLTGFSITGAANAVLCPMIDRDMSAWCYLTCGNSNLPAGTKDIRWRGICQNNQQQGGSVAGAYNADATAFTQIKVYPDTGNLLAGSTLDIYRINNS